MNVNSEQMLQPVSIAGFFSSYWEKQPLHIERSDPGYFAELVSRQNIESLLATRSMSFPDVQLVNSASPINVSDYTGEHRRIAVPQLMLYFNSGATLVISGVHEQFAAIADLCRSITASFQMRSQANLYLSPRGGQGFKPHYDTHDVFILQIEGQKTFRIYESPVELPFTDDTFDAQSFEAGPLQEEIVLSAGDTLYIPRGVVHDAVANDDCESLHLTVGVFAVVARDVLQEAIQVAAERNVDLRRSVGLTPASLVGGDEASDVVGQLETLLGTEAKPVVSAALERLLNDVSTSASVATQRGLAGPITADTLVVVNRDVVLHLEESTDTVKLWLCGQVLEFGAPMSEAVVRLFDLATATQVPFKVGEIAGLKPDQQLVLCRQLMASGALRRV